MTPLIIRFAVGGTVVCLFAVLGDLLKPRSFAGLFSVSVRRIQITVCRFFAHLADGRCQAI
jgi:hypothetical protein